ncbi:MAG: cation:proton antiporter, partial [Candidatus Paceibacterota bacterium]
MLLKLIKNKILMFAIFSLFIGKIIFASSGGENGENGAVMTLLWMGIILLFAMIGRLIEKIKQPSVLGELLIGVLIGNLGLVGIHFFDPIKTNVFISFLAEIGVIILLFQVGLESNLSEMKKVGVKAFLVAIVGVVVPFVLGTW